SGRRSTPSSPSATWRRPAAAPKRRPSASAAGQSHRVVGLLLEGGADPTIREPATTRPRSAGGARGRLGADVAHHPLPPSGHQVTLLGPKVTPLRSAASPGFGV